LSNTSILQIADSAGSSFSENLASQKSEFQKSKTKQGLGQTVSAMEVEMDSSGKEGEVPVGRKSGHKGEVEDEAGKRRKIDIDGFVELQRVEGKEDAEKMEMDDIREREVVPKRDRYAADDRERHVGVVLVDWLCMAGAKESEKGGVGCEEAKTEPDAKYRRTEEVGHDSSNVQMEVEELLLHREVVEKPDHMMEVGGEAAKILEHETDKMGECKASKMDTAAEERKRGLEKYEQWRKRKEEEQMPPPDPEERMDPLAFHARSFEKRWNFLYANWIYGSFRDNSECLVNQLLRHLTHNNFILPSTIYIQCCRS
jgi:hypothetical protein